MTDTKSIPSHELPATSLDPKLAAERAGNNDSVVRLVDLVVEGSEAGVEDVEQRGVGRVYLGRNGKHSLAGLAGGLGDELFRPIGKADEARAAPTLPRRSGSP